MNSGSLQGTVDMASCWRAVCWGGWSRPDLSEFAELSREQASLAAGHLLCFLLLNMSPSKGSSMSPGVFEGGSTGSLMTFNIINNTQ